MAIIEGIRQAMTDLIGYGVYKEKVYPGGVQTYSYMPTSTEIQRFPNLRDLKGAHLQIGYPNNESIRMIWKTREPGKLITHSASYLGTLSLADLDTGIERLAAEHSEHQVVTGPALSIEQWGKSTVLRQHRFSLNPEAKVGVWLEVREMTETLE